MALQFTDFSQLDLSLVPSPAFVVDEAALERNLAILKDVADRSGAKVLAALKAFSMWELAPLTAQYLNGTCSSGLHEALLGRDHYGGEVHVFAAAFNREDLLELLQFAHHIVFNSCGQISRFRPELERALAERSDLSIGLRVNPEHSEGEVPLYDPCAPGSRLGMPRSELDNGVLDLVSGLHFHTLCEQDFLPLQRTIAAFEEKFGDLLPQMKWVNFGGGHHITAPGYQVEALIESIQGFSERHKVQVYLEPGEAVAIGTGVLVTEVLDITYNELPQAILDTSATCHMPDTLEMPYRAEILGAGMPQEHNWTYRLGGLTCLAGDVMGDYSFTEALQVGQRLMFMDMSHYTMVKTSTFNGTKLPALVVWNSNNNKLKVVKTFGYHDFLNRLS